MNQKKKKLFTTNRPNISTSTKAQCLVERNKERKKRDLHCLREVYERGREALFPSCIWYEKNARRPKIISLVW